MKTKKDVETRLTQEYQACSLGVSTSQPFIHSFIYSNHFYSVSSSSHYYSRGEAMQDINERETKEGDQDYNGETMSMRKTQ